MERNLINDGVQIQLMCNLDYSEQSLKQWFASRDIFNVLLILSCVLDVTGRVSTVSE